VRHVCKIACQALWVDMVTIPERPHELTYIAMVRQWRPSRRGRLKALYIWTCFFVRLPTSVL